MHDNETAPVAIEALTLTSVQPTRFVLRRFDCPSLGPGEVLLRCECCTLCGSDLHTLSGRRPTHMPTILGHEVIGWVEALGAGEILDGVGHQLAAGDRITWSVAVACGECDRCQRGLTQKCRRLFKYGHERWDAGAAPSGGLASHVVLRAGTDIVRLPAEGAAEVYAPANCATATVVAAFEKAGDCHGRNVLVIGAGMLGLTACAYADAQGAATVVVIDTDATRLALAPRFGATDCYTSSTAVQESAARYDIVLELTGSVAGVSAACDLADVGGQVLLVGSVFPTPPVPIAPETLVRRLVSLHGIHNYRRQDLVAAVNFLAANAARYPFAQLVGATFRLAEIEAALGYMVEHRPVRVAIVPR